MSAGRTRFIPVMLEPRSVTWRRRATTIPMMLAGTAVAVFGAPIIVLALAVLDLIRVRTRLPALRVYAFTLQYMVNDSVEILLAPVLWAMASFGTRLGSPASIGRHHRLQTWSLNLLEQRAAQLLGLRLHLADDVVDRLRPAPVVIIGRHVSLFDASLPGVVCERAGLRARGVIMAELLADPGFDLLYGRLGSVFIPREGRGAVAAIEAMTGDGTSAEHGNAAFIIFPEGRLFSPPVRDRLLGRLAEKDPERAERLQTLQHLLPPRPTGLRTLLQSLPGADVVVLDHRGLDQLPSMKQLAARAPLDTEVAVSATRIPRAEIPDDDEEFTRWLDQLWVRLDVDVAADGDTGGDTTGRAD